MAIEPCGYRLAVRPLTLEEADDGYKTSIPGFSIAKTDEFKAKEMGIDQGVVISLGPTAFKDYGDVAWCKAGDTIAYAKYSGKLLDDPDTREKILILNDQDVVAIIKREGA